MGQMTFGLNGLLPSRPPVTMLRRFLLTASVTLLIPACATQTTVTSRETIARPFSQIAYDSGDKASPYYAGPALVEQIRVHNFTCIRLGCKRLVVKP